MNDKSKRLKLKGLHEIRKGKTYIPPHHVPGEIVTEDLIERARTPRGGWSKEALAWLGVEYPPLHGWKQRIIGRPIESVGQEQLLMGEH